MILEDLFVYEGFVDYLDILNMEDSVEYSKCYEWCKNYMYKLGELPVISVQSKPKSVLTQCDTVFTMHKGTNVEGVKVHLEVLKERNHSK